VTLYTVSTLHTLLLSVIFYYINAINFTILIYYIVTIVLSLSFLLENYIYIYIIFNEILLYDSLLLKYTQFDLDEGY